MKKLCLFAILMVLVITAKANHWTPNSAPYATTATMIGIVQIDGVEQSATTLEVGAFCGDECRGSGMPMFVSQLNRSILYLTIYGNDGDNIGFRLYDHALGQERDVSCASTITYASNEVYGAPMNQFVLNFVTNVVSYTISASASPTNGGSVIGAGTYDEGQTCTLRATANTGYSFVRWTKNGSQVSTNSTYSFTVTANASYVAVFSLNSYTISASANPTAGGTVSGGGTYDYGSSCTLTATPATGYSFVLWTKNGNQVSNSPSYSFTVTENASYVAVFSLNSYTISVSVSPSEGGSVSGAGSYNYGSSCTLTAMANSGYTFNNWTENGEVVSVEATYSFPVEGNRNLVANFQIQEDVIVFADPNVKAICVANWDTNGSGELSYEEAAAVTDLGQVFRSNTTITSFEELQYFTGLNEISNYAFENCTNLSGNLYIPNSVTTIGAGAFYGCGGFTGTLTIPNSVTTIGGYAFSGCSGFTGSLTIPNTVTTLESYAFSGCSGFTGSLTIPNSVIEIGDGTFSGCSGFVGSLTIPNSVTTIGNHAFSGCSGFTGSLTIPNSVTTIGNHAFGVCSGFTGSLTIPNSVTSIGHGAFYNCSGFTGSLTIPNSVTEIGWGAFYGCSGFTGSLTIPNSVTTIDEDAFRWCSGFTGNLTIPNSVTTIGSMAFSDCSGFTGSLTIGNSVTLIGDDAFRFCSGFSSMTVMPETPPTLGQNVFLCVSQSIPVYVPCGSSEAYQTAVGWNEFTNYQGMNCSYHFTTAGNWSTASNWSNGTLPQTVDEVFIDAPCQLDQDATVEALTVSEGQSLTLQSGKTLTVTSTLINTSTSGLIIEDGAQLVHASENVSAMVKKNIAGHGTSNGKYCLISNPLTEAVDPEMSNVYHLIRGSYDLYDWLPSAPDDLEWRNFKDNIFMMYPDGFGYLYANRNGVELNFPGILNPSRYRFGKAVSYDSSDTEHPGWNLIGNPFMCNAKLVNANNEPVSYYRMNAAGDGFVSDTSGAIAPMEGVFYQASENGTVYFVRADNTSQIPTFTISVSANPSDGGSVNGGGTYQQGQAITLRATANNGFIFVNWTENGEMVSTDVNYTFTVGGDRVLVANFTGDHAYVDLGLPSGLLWATCNVGADTPEGYGDYFAWGETQPKDTYNWSTYQYCMGSNNTLTKYSNISSYGYNGFTDNLTTLLPEDDAATANWGGNWRMPTKAEFEELYNNTTHTWTTQNGVNGRLFTAANGNSLFLPAAGYRDDSSLNKAGSFGLYWSSSLYTGIPDYAWYFRFLSSNASMSNYGYRNYGRSVRAVREN